MMLKKPRRHGRYFIAVKMTLKKKTAPKEGRGRCLVSFSMRMKTQKQNDYHQVAYISMLSHPVFALILHSN